MPLYFEEEDIEKSKCTTKDIDKIAEITALKNALETVGDTYTESSSAKIKVGKELDNPRLVKEGLKEEEKAENAYKEALKQKEKEDMLRRKLEIKGCKI